MVSFALNYLHDKWDKDISLNHELFVAVTGVNLPIIKLILDSNIICIHHWKFN